MRADCAGTLLVLFAAVGAIFAPVAYAAPTLSFLSTQGTSIVDSAGRVVILRGVNYPGYQQEYPKLHDSAAYWTLGAGFGFNVVRLPISWANLEPQPGNFNWTYLSWYVDQDVHWANSARIYVILDMHQYDWARRFGGNGAPEWTVQNYAPNKTGMLQAISDFWSNDDLQGHLVQVWAQIAQHFANEPTIAGYDVFNEPFVYLYNGQAVANLYARIVNAIRASDQNHMIFLETDSMNTFKLATRTNIVWSPHFYPRSFATKYSQQDFNVLENDFIAKYRSVVIESGTPMWIGEFGAFMQDSTSRATWTQDALTLFNRYQVGWAWWAFNGQYTSIPDQLYVPS